MESNTPLPPPQAITTEPRSLQMKKPRRKKRLVMGILIVVISLIVAAMIGAIAWYRTQLQPVATSQQEVAAIPIVIEPGSTAGEIGTLLETHGVIRSSLAFDVYTRLNNIRNSFQSGSYTIDPRQTLPEVVQQIIDGDTEVLTITFLPGATLAENRQVLIDAGFEEERVDEALAADYSDMPLFATKPASADLEGYIYGETYTFNGNVSVETVLSHVFEVFYEKIAANGLVAALQAQGLTLYEGITLASIVQREVTATNPSVVSEDQQKVAQVFLTRLARDMQLGSDVTYQYAADKLGVERSVDLDSPYNTRRYTGLPPGPIAVPGLGALQAVANPANTDYLFFLSGDDDVTYFGKTEAEHQRNIELYCQEKCLII